MLETAIHQLSILTEERGYREAAKLLEATSQLAANFDSYKSVPKVCEVGRSSRRCLAGEYRGKAPLFSRHTVLFLAVLVLERGVGAVSAPLVRGAPGPPTPPTLRLRGGLGDVEPADDVDKEAFGFYKLLGVERHASYAVSPFSRAQPSMHCTISLALSSRYMHVISFRCMQ